MKWKTKFIETMKRYKHAWVFLYALIYMPWFWFLEKHVTMNYHVVQTALDEEIPFYVKKGRYLRKTASLFALYFVFRVLFCTLYNFQLLFLLKMYIFISNVILHNQILYLPEKFL